MERLTQKRGIIYTAIIMGILIIAVPSVSGASAPVSPHNPMILTQGVQGGPILYLAPNTTDGIALPIWNLTLYQDTGYSIMVNGRVLVTGNGPYQDRINMSQWSSVNVSITEGGTTYTLRNYSIIPVLPVDSVTTAEIVTEKAGQAPLSVLPGQQSVILYQQATFNLISMDPYPFHVYVDGSEVAHGTVSGQAEVNLTLPTGMHSITVTIGQTILNFNKEIISSIPISQYYGKHPLAPIATLQQELVMAGTWIGIGLVNIIPVYLAVTPIIKRWKSQNPQVW